VYPPVFRLWGPVLAGTRLASHGLSWWGRYKQTAHSLKSSLGTITVRNPVHPLRGQTLPLRNIRRVGEFLEYIVEHPDGGVLTLPAWATDAVPWAPPPRCRGSIPLLHPAQLVRLVHRLTTLQLCPPSADKPGEALWDTTPVPQEAPYDTTRHPAGTTATSPLDDTSTPNPSHGTAHRPPPPPSGQASARRQGGRL
jgi:hypothetical protein